MDNVSDDMYRELAKHLENLTTTRRNSDSEILKKVKNICRKSDGFVNRAYQILMHQLEKDHSEIRLYTVGVIDELFKRSHSFRELLLAEFQDFMELTMETDADYPLPPPKTAARNLKYKAIQCVQQWHEKFGRNYKQLQLGYRFLKNCKNIDFHNIEVRTQAERAREEQIERQRQAIIQDNIRKSLSAMSEKQVDIEVCVTQFNNAFQLLMSANEDIFTEEDFENPRPCCSKTTNEEDNIMETDEKVVDESQNSTVESRSSNDDDDENPNLVREHGLGSHTYNLEINVDVNKGIPVNTNNLVIITNLKELTNTLTSKYLPEVSKWVQTLSKSESNPDQLKKAIDFKQIIQQCLRKYKELNIPGDIAAAIESDDDDDDDFEEVPEKEGYEDDVKFTPVPDHNFNFTHSKLKEDLKDPTTLAANEKVLLDKICQPSTSSQSVPSSSSTTDTNSNDDIRKAELLNKAPKLRYDVDLFRWGEKLEAPSMIKLEGLHRWWQPPENETVEIKKPEDTASLRMRRIEFTGDFEPVKWQCRAPITNGKLCPRRDRLKCPFHGKIIPRDERGNPTNPADIERLKKEAVAIEKSKPPDWQDPELLREIKAATGLDLTVGKKSRKGKKKKYPELTDLKEQRNTTRRRLESKVLNKSAVKRVASSLDSADYKKFRDKFGDQFNYQF